MIALPSLHRTRRAPNEDRLIAAMAMTGFLATAEVARRANVGPSEAYRVLCRLEAQGVVVRLSGYTKPVCWGRA